METKIKRINIQIILEIITDTISWSNVLRTLNLLDGTERS